MADKMTCPGCDSHTSGVLTAFGQGEPCPHCGLSWAVSAELANKRATVRVSRANNEVKAIAEEALQRAGRAEAEAERLRRIVDGVRAALDPTEIDEGTTP